MLNEYATIRVSLLIVGAVKVAYSLAAAIFLSSYNVRTISKGHVPTMYSG